jgi:hypothetical protein
VNFGKSTILSAAVLLAGALAINAAEARPGGGRHFQGGGHFHGGGGRAFFFAAPVFVGGYFASRYYYPPYYYYPPPVYDPPVYIEQPQSQAYWYYCPSSRAYYPHVQSCAGAWQRVPPQPPPG